MEKRKKVLMTLTPETVRILDEVAGEMEMTRSALVTLMAKYMYMGEKVPFSRIMQMVIEDGMKVRKKKILSS